MASTPIYGAKRTVLYHRDDLGVTGMAKARETSAAVDIKIRMKEPLRADIERAATEKGISMNAEMVERLSRSFEQERMLDQASEWAYGRRLFALLSLLGRVAMDTGPTAAF